MRPQIISDDLLLSLQDSMLEILGQDELEGLLRLSDLEQSIRAEKPHEARDSTYSAQVSRLFEALENKYGLSSGWGLGFRIGRVLFTRILRANGAALGLEGNPFRLLPQPKKIRSGLKILSEWMQNQSDQIIQIDFQIDRILWRQQHCLNCRERRSDQPLCFMTAGFLHEAMFWFSGGKFYKVKESECEASGQSQCSFEIRLSPIQ